MEITKEIENAVRTIIAKSLMIPEDDVHLHSKLLVELEAESIDILDIRFGVEQHFGIKFSNEEIKKNLQRMATENDVTEKDIPNLFTVESICKYVVYKLTQKNEKQ
ncbi:MAG: acyl carrier protein [Polaribacter sp.]|jgi:acyl carrier protein